MGLRHADLTPRSVRAAEAVHRFWRERMRDAPSADHACACILATKKDKPEPPRCDYCSRLLRGTRRRLALRDACMGGSHLCSKCEKAKVLR